MDRENPAADILQGSTWEAPGERVHVIATAGGYVRFRSEEGAERIQHHRAFRRSFATLYDRVQVRSQFSMTIANLVECRIYWIPSARRIIARSLTCSKKWPIPPDAEEIGIYSQPFAAEAFLSDLDCVISSLLHRQRAGNAARAV